jgi:hypothetical protein
MHGREVDECREGEICRGRRIRLEQKDRKEKEEGEVPAE